MERTTCTLIYYLRKTRIDKERKAPIYVRLTICWVQAKNFKCNMCFSYSELS